MTELYSVMRFKVMPQLNFAVYEVSINRHLQLHRIQNLNLKVFNI